jgi:predicted dehydrogenase
MVLVIPVDGVSPRTATQGPQSDAKFRDDRERKGIVRMLRVGILGAGYFGAVHARALSALPEVQLVAVCAETEALADAFAAEHGGKPYGDWQAFLADSGVDAVAVAAPHQLHCEMAVAAAEAGKHVLLEKPMARTVAECSRIIAAAERSGVTLMIGHLLHFSLPGLVARRIIASGELGRPVLGSSALLKLWMEPNRRGWHLDAASGGGMLMTAGIHALDLLIWLMGGQVEAVSAATATLFHAQAADDSSMLLLRFADGRFGQVASVGYRDGGTTYGMDLVCERGTLRIDFARGVAIGRDGCWSGVPGSIEPEWMLRGVEREWQAMAAAIAGTAPVAVTGAYGRHVIACIEAAMASSRERREVRVEA